MESTFASMSSRLIIADSESNADLYYASQFLVPDPVIYCEHKKKKYLVLNQLEYDRGHKEAQVDTILSLEELKTEFVQNRKKSPENLGELAFFLLKKLKIKKITLPQNFPAAFAFDLKKKGIHIEFGSLPFYQERQFKNNKEKEFVKENQKWIGKAIQEAYRVLRASKIKGKYIYYENKKLTSEKLRSCIDLFLLARGYSPQNTIVASGDQAVDPHCRGEGPLLAHTAIIIDVFPHHSKSRYFGDQTRTVVKGKAPAQLKKQWLTVKAGQELGIKMIKAGVNGKKIHTAINHFFEKSGFKTGKVNGSNQGFFHGTGHGVGLEIHEAPRVNSSPHILKTGEIVTVEPGLYYPGIGGVRIEDIVYVTQTGAELFPGAPKILEIP